MSDELDREILRLLMALHSRFSAVERALEIEVFALIQTENTEMNTMSSILAQAQSLATSAAAGQVNEQHLIDAANAHVTDLQNQLAAAQANQADQTTIDGIAAAITSAQGVADAMNAAGQTPTPAPTPAPADTSGTQATS